MNTRLMMTGLALAALPTAALAAIYGDTPDAKHAWAVHDYNRPKPAKVEPADACGQPPSDAVVLFDGTKESFEKNWCDSKGQPSQWKLDPQGFFYCIPGWKNGGSVLTRASFGDCQLHIEFRHDPANMITDKGPQMRGNSGVFLMGNYEIQVLESYFTSREREGQPDFVDNYADGQAGAVYAENPPLVNPARKPGGWQVYDIVFHQPVWEGDTLVHPGSITLFFNGVLVQDHWEMEGLTTHSKRRPLAPHATKGQLSLQDHGCTVQYRNVWYRPLASRWDNTTHSAMSAKTEDVMALRRETAAKLYAKIADPTAATAENVCALAEVVSYANEGVYAESFKAALKAFRAQKPDADANKRVKKALDVLVRNKVIDAEYEPEAWNLAARKKFADQRFGIFIHWGLYANYAQGEWYQQRIGMDTETYGRMIDGFCPSKFDAKEWVRVFKQAGAKYVTITSRHHDGFSLWPTKVDDGYNIANTPFRRDILGELSKACDEAGLQLNFYYSLMDWHRRDYPAGDVAVKVFGPQKGDYASYKKFMLGQIGELIDSYHPGNIWFDGEWEHARHQPDGSWKRTLDWDFDTIYDFIHSKKTLVANNNHQPIRPKEDIQLFERDLPGDNSDAGFSKNQPVTNDRPVEQCDVIQHKVWGYRIGETKFRTAEDVVAMVARAAAKGSNLLMNIGPDGSGRLPARAVAVMERVGAWFGKNGESIYGTEAGGIAKGKAVVSTRKGNVLYLHFLDPAADAISFKVDGEVASATCLQCGTDVPVAKTPAGETLVTIKRPKDNAFDIVVKLVVK